MYYPEPNLCIQIPPDKETVEEDFGPKKAEAIQLMRALRKRTDSQFSFHAGRPLFTQTPDRAQRTKIIENDKTTYCKLPQSHLCLIKLCKGLTSVQCSLHGSFQLKGQGAVGKLNRRLFDFFRALASGQNSFQECSDLLSFCSADILQKISCLFTQVAQFNSHHHLPTIDRVSRLFSDYDLLKPYFLVIDNDLPNDEILKHFPSQSSSFQSLISLLRYGFEEDDLLLLLDYDLSFEEILKFAAAGFSLEETGLCAGCGVPFDYVQVKICEGLTKDQILECVIGEFGLED